MGFNVIYTYAFKSSESFTFDLAMPMESHIFIDENVIENCYTMTAVPFIVCDSSLDVAAEIKKNPRGTARISYHIFNNKIANPAVNLVPLELKRFFRKESDCPYGKVVLRKIPAQVTGKRK